MTKAVVRLQESLSSLSRTIVKSLAMPRRCVAADCKTTSRMGYSLHSFPTDENMRRRWTSAVKRYRKDWDGPSTSFLLCSRHFTEDSFETEGSLYRDTFGIPAQKRLKPDAVPTVFPKSINQLHTSSSSASHSCPLSERREQRSVVEELLSATTSAESTLEHMDTTNSTVQLPLCHTSTDSMHHSSTLPLCRDPMSHSSTMPDPLTQEKNPKKKSVSVTVRVKGKKKATQTDTCPQQISIGTQCNLLNAPPLQRLPQVTSLNDSFVTEEETDLDTSFLSNQEDYTTEDDTQELPPQDEVKFLVYRSHLLSLFTACRSCHQLCDGEVANLKGTFISIRQSCHHCGYTWVWNSQPFIRDTPAANILLSAAILFSGSTPGKIFHFLGCLRVACTTDRTFHLHQSQYLQPAVISVWNHHQHQILSAIAKKDCPLTVGGDGRADSPGHSAKYGSYGVIDLDTKFYILNLYRAMK
ncbi:THAP domain-containing protein 5-like isoform X2 [Dysidea avara]|uniref:THAP domain-containing protein 5-like isoform X2 n=1 Tax=Dysidea avara TaxID=196820 RepID=UPI00331B494C